MRVLVDTNIILDDFLEREPFVEDAAALMEAIESEGIVGYVTATTLTTALCAQVFTRYPVEGSLIILIN